MFNSRFDAWQMDNDLQVPCKAGDPKHKACNPAEQAAVVEYGVRQPVDFRCIPGAFCASAPRS